MPKRDTSLAGQVRTVCDQRRYLRSAIESILVIGKGHQELLHSSLAKTLQEALDYTAQEAP